MKDLEDIQKLKNIKSALKYPPFIQRTINILYNKDWISRTQNKTDEFKTKFKYLDTDFREQV
jgi:hypothetical protein